VQVEHFGVNSLEQKQPLGFLSVFGDEGCDTADEGVCPEFLLRREIFSPEHLLQLEKQNLSITNNGQNMINILIT
jgi:hypothetical protein